MLIQILLLTMFSQDSPKAEITGKVVSIADGDTITILTAEKKQVKIRLNGIDAPERGQAFGTKSKEMLSHIIGKSDVRVETHGEDRYGRTIGDVFVRTPNSAVSDPEANLNFMMVANGYAWHYVRYAPDNKVHPGLLWVEAEATAVEEDGCFKVLTVSEATDSSLDGHDFAVHAFGNGVGDSVSAIAHDILQTLLD